MTAEFHKDMTNEEYHSRTDVLSKSMLSDMADCPARFKHHYIDGNKKPQTEALRIGSAVHTLALEPEKWQAGYHVMPTTYFNDKGEKKQWRNDKRMRVYQDEMMRAGFDIGKDENEDLVFTARPNAKIVLDNDQYSEIEKMAEALTKDKYALSLIKSPGYVESSIFFDLEHTSEETGESVKIRSKVKPDLMRNDGLIIDLKTARSAAPFDFCAVAHEKNYDLSVALTFAGYEALNGKEPDNYVFIAIEKEAPYLVSCFESVQPMESLGGISYLDYGRAHLQHLLGEYLKCKSANEWPGYVEKIETMKIPGWGMKNFMEKGFKK